MFVVVALVVVAIGTFFMRWTRFGRQVYAVGSNPEAAAILGIPSRLVVFAAFALCGLLSGVAGVMWVIEFGTINGTSATGVVLAVIAAVVVGGVSISGGSGTVAGAALGALFLGFVANALILVGLSQFWLQAIYGVVILVAVSADALILRRLQRATAERGSDERRHHAKHGRPAWVAGRACSRAGRSLLFVALIGLIVMGNALSPVFLSARNFSNLLAALMEVAIMAMPMTLIIVAAEIDLSVESMAGLASAVLGFLWAAGVPLTIGIPIVLVIGALGGLLERAARSPAAACRRSWSRSALWPCSAAWHSSSWDPKGVSDFPPIFTELGFGHVPGTLIPWPFVIFGVLALILGDRAPSDVDRTADLRHRQEPGRRPLLRACGSRGSGPACSCYPASSPPSPASS